MRKVLSETRKKIIVFWYLYNKANNMWPNYRQASDELGIVKSVIHYHVSFLVKNEWMIKAPHQVALTKEAEQFVREKEAVAIGEKRKEINHLYHRIKRLAEKHNERRNQSS